MDRHDEQKPDRSNDVPDQAPNREGDILGLGGTSVPKAPGDPSTEYDPESVARRRERAAGLDETGTEATTDLPRSKGATGIDMGAGGSGTDVSGK